PGYPAAARAEKTAARSDRAVEERGTGVRGKAPAASAETRYIIRAKGRTTSQKRLARTLSEPGTGLTTARGPLEHLRTASTGGVSCGRCSCWGRRTARSARRSSRF